MTDGPLDLALTVLDRQLIDREGRKCGRVDDIELSGQPGQPLIVDSLVVGAGAWQGRVRPPIWRLLSRLGGNQVVEVPWSEVCGVTHVVKLQSTAAELGLARGDARAGALLGRMPKA
jgi:sporulation protein YlmC with PRC-barrel domain